MAFVNEVKTSTSSFCHSIFSAPCGISNWLAERFWERSKSEYLAFVPKLCHTALTLSMLTRWGWPHRGTAVVPDTLLLP